MKSIITFGLLCLAIIVFSQNKPVNLFPPSTNDSIRIKQFSVELLAAQQALKAKPDNAFNNYTLGQLYYDIKKYDSSFVYFKKAAKLEPSQPIYQKMLGYTYFFIQDYTSAIPYIESALRLEPTDDTCQFSIGICYYQTAQYAKCIDAMNATVLLNPKQVRAYSYIGTCYFLLKNEEKAIENLKKSILFYPEEAEIHHILGVCYDRTNQPYEARNQINIALQLSPSNAEFEISMAENKLKLNEYAEALSIYYQLLPTYESKEDIYFYIANVYNNEKKHDSAIYFYQQVLSINADFTEAYLPLAISYFANKDFVQAIEWFTKAQNKTNTSAINNYLGLSYYGLKNFLKAIDYFNQAILIDKSNAIVYYNLARVYKLLDQPQKAISYLEISTRLLPKDIDGFLLLAKLHDKIGEIKNAIIDYQEVIKIRSTPTYSMALADLFVEDHQYKEAFSIYQNLLLLDSNSADLHYRVGLCYEGDKLLPQAQTSYFKALAKNPIEKLYLYAIANTYFQLADYKNALLYIDQAIQQDGTFAKAYYLLGYVKYNMGKIKEAKEAFANAHAFDTNLQIPDFIK